MQNKLKVAVDQKTYGWQYLRNLNWLSVVPIADINDIDQADALIISTQFKVETEQLCSKKIYWLGLASSGMDHIDPVSLKQHNIHFCVAKGCNANAVAEYVIAVIGKYCKHTHTNSGNLSVGIIGYGNVGQATAKKLSTFMQHTKWCDPLQQINREDYEKAYRECLQCDIVSLHCSLRPTETSEYPLPSNQNLLSLAQLEHSNIKLLINAARGEVISSDLVQTNLTKCKLAIDTHRGEPSVVIDTNQYWLASPHIAGQTFLSRVNSLQILIDDLYKWYRQTQSISTPVTFDSLSFNRHLQSLMVPPVTPIVNHTQLDKQQIEQFGLPVDAINNIINLQVFHDAFIEQTTAFNTLRKNYLRHEFTDYADLFIACGMSKLLVT